MEKPINRKSLNESSSTQRTIELPEFPIQFEDLKKALLEYANASLSESFSSIKEDDELERSFMEEKDDVNIMKIDNKSVESLEIHKLSEDVFNANSEAENESELNTSFIQESKSLLDDATGSTVRLGDAKTQKLSNSYIQNNVSLDKYATPTKKFLQLHEFKTPMCSSINKHTTSKSTIKSRYLTPSNVLKSYAERSTTKAPKVQCSIKIQSYNKTPFNVDKKESIKKSSLTLENRSQKANNKLYSTSKIQSSVNKENVDNIPNAKNVKFSLSKKELFVEDLKTVRVKDTEYLILRQLGRGGSSVVLHCYDPISKCEAAVKKVFLAGDQAQGYINEVSLLSTLQKCDRIIKMYDFEIVEDEQVMHVVLEKGDTDLSKIMKSLASKTDHLPMYMLIFYWMEMLYAVQQIHENGIIHSDLKPANFLKAQGGIKLIDFGIASSIQSEATSVIKDVARGSFNYISPESLNDQGSSNVNSPRYGTHQYKISYKTDVWSLGCILYELVYKKTPFQHITNTLVKLNTILDPKHQIQFPQANWVPPKIIETMKACLRYDMKSRPSIKELIQDFERFYY